MCWPDSAVQTILIFVACVELCWGGVGGHAPRKNPHGNNRTPMSKGRRNAALIWFHSSTWAKLSLKPSQALLWCAHSVGKGVVIVAAKDSSRVVFSFHKLFGIEILHVLVYPAAISGHIVHCPGRYGPFSGDMSLLLGGVIAGTKRQNKKNA